MTSASLAISAQKDKYLNFLKLLFLDEIEKKEAQRDFLAKANARYCLWKIKSLTSHDRIIK